MVRPSGLHGPRRKRGLTRLTGRAIGLLLLLLGLLAGGGSASGAIAQGSGAAVHVTELRGTVNPVTADVLTDALERAERDGAQALLIEVDTPGGLDTSMRRIVQAFLNADVPVIVHVSPSGARAASAGTFITMSAHIAAMAPGTTIGAATPVDLQGAEISDKVVNDAASYAVAIAEERGRSVEFAEAAVRDGRSVGASEALDENVVDVLASSRDELLSAIDGRDIAVGDRTVTLATDGAAVEEHQPSLLRRLLARVVDPNLAFVFISLGTLAVLSEFANPGIGAGAITGAILLILAFYALSVLPTNIAGIALLILAMALLIGELFVPGVGVLAGGGTIALLLAGIFLFPRASGIGVDLAVLIPVTAVAGAGGAAIALLARRVHGRPPESGDERIVGRRAEVRRSQGNQGQVFVDGALWTARSSEDLIQGAMVRVVARDGLTLTVEPEEQASDGDGEPNARAPTQQTEDETWT